VRVGLGRSTEEVEEGLRRFAAAVEETAAGGAG
jgi:hypothetical protein